MLMEMVPSAGNPKMTTLKPKGQNNWVNVFMDFLFN